MDLIRKIILSFLDKVINTSRYVRYLMLLPFTPILRFLFAFVGNYLGLDKDEKNKVVVKNWKVYARIVAYGDLGVGESYMEGWWDCGDLRGLLHAFSELDCAPSLVKGYTWTPYYFEVALRWIFFNVQGREEALAPCDLQYNLPVDYYRRFSDSALNHSMGYYGFGATSLEQAHTHKMHLIASKLQLKKGMRLLDIGCGFGGLCKFLAENYGVEAVGITNSTGMGKRAKEFCGSSVQIQVCDWRDIQGTFDRITVIEMSEHAGKHNLGEFYRKINSMLNKGGRCLVQVYTLSAGCPQMQEFSIKYLYGAAYFPLLEEVVHHSQEVLELGDIQNFKYDTIRTYKDFLDMFYTNWEEMGGIVGQETVRAMAYMYTVVESFFKVGLASVTQFVFVKKEDTEMLHFPRSLEQVLDKKCN